MAFGSLGGSRPQSSHQYAAWHRRRVQTPPAPSARQRQRWWHSMQQQQQRQQWQHGGTEGAQQQEPPEQPQPDGAESEQLIQPFRWHAPPLRLLGQLADSGSPRLPSHPPAADQRYTMVVRLHLDQVRKPPGQRLEVFRKDLEALLFRQGVQQPNSTTQWAATHSCAKDLSCVEASVHDAATAWQAAKAAVELGYVEVAQFRVPVSWGRRMAPPPGCTVVTFHQMPTALTRQGCTAVLMAAAKQAGEVVCEFLGGSRTMGDASQSAPASDTVVAWVRTPEADPFLTSLPPSAAVHGGPMLRVEVDGRPSLAPELWPHLTQEHFAAEAAALQVIAHYSTRRQQRTTAHPSDLPDSLDDEPIPPGQQRQQHQGQQQQQQPQSQQQQQPQRQQQQHQHEQQQSSGTAQEQRQHRQRQREQRPGGRLQTAAGTAGGAAPADTHMSEAEIPPPAGEWQHHQQQGTARAQRQHRQQRRVQRPGGQRQAAVGAVGADTPMTEAEIPPPVEERPASPPQQAPDVHMQEAEGGAAGDTAWVADQLRLMLEDAVGLVDEEEARQLSQAQRDRLCQAFRAHFQQSLDKECSPPERAVRSWLREQLGIPEGSYEVPSEEEAEQAPLTPEPQPQQQQQQQQPSRPPPRRSERRNKGQLGDTFAAIHGAVMGCSSSGQSRERAGKGTQQHLAPATPQVASPTAAPPPRPERGRGGTLK